MSLSAVLIAVEPIKQDVPRVAAIAATHHGINPSAYLNPMSLRYPWKGGHMSLSSTVRSFRVTDEI